MQFKTLALSLFVAVAAADQISDLVKQIPSCAQPCLADAIKKVGCGETDYTCQCSKTVDLTTAATTCVIGACSGPDLLTTQDISTKLCTAVASGAGASASGSLSSALASATSSLGAAASSATAASATATPSKAAGGRLEVGAMAMVGAALFAL